MSKHNDPNQPDIDNPEWTAQTLANAMRFNDLPLALQAKLGKPGRPKAEVTKERISIRLSPDVLGAFRASGPGWQTRMDAALRQWLEEHPVSEGKAA